MEAASVTTARPPASWSQATPQYDLDAAFPVDPYLVWAELSDWAGFGGPSHHDQVRILLELKSDLEGSDPLSRKVRGLIESNRLNPIVGSKILSPFATANVSVSSGDLKTLTAAIGAGLLARFQLGLARVWPSDEASSIELDASALGDRVPKALAHENDGVFETIGMVDDGCCLAHEWLGAQRKTSFLLVWDQSPIEPKAPWQRFAGVSYGAELSQGTIDALLDKHQPLGEPAERRFYADVLGRKTWGAEGRTHGAGILHIVSHSRRASARGELPLIFVQLPADTVADTSGGSLGVYLLDGARYIVQRTRLMASLYKSLGLSGDYRTTINVSLGSIAGPHDGSTITELALAELAADPRVNLVLAAGNTAGKQVHAVRRIAAGSPGRFTVLLPPDNPRESYVEVWLPINGSTASADDFSLSIIAPNGLVSPPLRVGQAIALREAQATQAAVVFARSVAQGRNGTMALLAVCSTRPNDPSQADAGPYGFWTIEVSTRLSHELEVHAWVERNDIIIGRPAPQQSRFVDDGSGYVNDDCTLSSVANGDNVVVVGAYRQADKRVTDYSANGPTRNGAARRGPDCYAPSDESASLRGLTVPGFFSGSWTRLSGTSVAAPVVTRWFAKGRPSDQACDVHAVDGTTVHGVEPESED